VRAVIDKDRTASMLARELAADLFVIATSVDRVAVGFGRKDVRWLDEVHAEELQHHFDAGEFPPGSMGPKVEAVLEYLGAGGRRAVITDPSNLKAAVTGAAGTTILP